MWFQDFQDGLLWWPSWISERNDFSNSESLCLGYMNGTILAILNLYVALMLPIKYWLNPAYFLGGDVV